MSGNGAKTDYYKTTITILLTMISLLLSYFAVESRANKNDIIEIKIKRSAEQVSLVKMQEDIKTILLWVESQKTKNGGK